MLLQDSKCPVMTVKLRLEKFYNDASKEGMCSKCHPCKLGIFDAIQIFNSIQEGKGQGDHISQLRRIAAEVKDGGMCKKGKDHADMLGAFLKDSEVHIDRHIKGGCAVHECKQLVRYEINADACTMCDQCRTACKDNAIEGQKMVPPMTGYAPYRIRQKRCTHCGECMAVCPEQAVYIFETAAAIEIEYAKPERHASGPGPADADASEYAKPEPQVAEVST
jgi:ferredoxin